MKRSDFYLAAMRAESYRRSDWVRSVFALTRQGPDDWKNDPYPYRVVPTPSGYFFVDPDADNTLTRIDDADPAAPMFYVRERLKVKAGALPNLNEDIETTYGRILGNCIYLVYPFGKKIPFINKRIDAEDLEKIILGMWVDDVPPDGDRREDRIYCDEYIRFCDGMFHLENFTQLFVTAATPKSMTFDPNMLALREKLLEENKDRLHDPTVVAKIAKELQDVDRAWIKGDPSEDFFIKSKSYEVIRSKLFSMVGAESGLKDGVDVELIQNSLAEGWNMEKLPAMINNLRAGSYNRGASTAMGGEAVKWLLRASSNLRISMRDCGSKLGNEIKLTEKLFDKYRNFHIVGDKGPIQLTDEVMRQMKDKVVYVRSPMYCKAEATDYCEICCGEKLAANPTSLPMVVSEYGSRFLYIYMGAMHGKALTLAKMNFEEAIF